MTKPKQKTKISNAHKRPSTNPPVRKLHEPSHKSFRLSKKIKKPATLPKARLLFKDSSRHLWKYKRVFGGITAIYLLATILLVKGLSIGSNVPEIKASLDEVLTGASGQLTTGISLFGYLVGNVSGVSGETAGTYQSIVLILISLALVWVLRQTYAGNTIRVRDSFYKGMYPLIPFLVVLLVIGLQCIPLAIASWIFNATIVSGLAVTLIEQALWTLLVFLLALLTLYMVSSSIFALYVSTLPDMTPLKALRSTRDLVRNRRWAILRKVAFLPVVLFLAGAIIVVPVIIFLTPLAEWLFFVLSMLALVLSHGYFYKLYRELL